MNAIEDARLRFDCLSLAANLFKLGGETPTKEESLEAAKMFYEWVSNRRSADSL